MLKARTTRKLTKLKKTNAEKKFESSKDKLNERKENFGTSNDKKIPKTQTIITLPKVRSLLYTLHAPHCEL